VMPHRREMAARMGSDCVLDPTAVDVVAEIRRETGGTGVDVVLEMSGAEQAVHQAFEMTTNGGRVYLFHNESGSNHSLRLKLAGTKSNRDGIGAIVRVTCGADKQWKMLRSGSSYLSQSELVLTFGLGSAVKADSIEVQWPSGLVDRLANVHAEQEVTVQESKGVIATKAYAKSWQSK